MLDAFIGLTYAFDRSVSLYDVCTMIREHVLECQLIPPECYYSHQCNLQRLPRGGYTGDEPINLGCVSALEDHFID
jgi:hypothetical protein